MPRFDDALLSDFASGFYGYGDYGAPYWFVGMEEGGGDAFENVAGRLEAWDDQGRPELADLRAFCYAIGETKWYGPRAQLQATWSRQIRVLLAAEGRSVTTEAVRRYQVGSYGRAGDESAVVELLPLPSPSAKHWHYAERSALPELRSRERYFDHYAPRRAEHLRGRIAEHRPRAVVFASTDARYLRWWDAIAGTRLADRAVEGQRVRVGRGGATTFVVMPHPTAWGLTNEFFEGVGRLVREAA